jgi:hypothetical protein
MGQPQSLVFPGMMINTGPARTANCNAIKTTIVQGISSSTGNFSGMIESHLFAATRSSKQYFRDFRLTVSLITHTKTEALLPSRSLIAS